MSINIFIITFLTLVHCLSTAAAFGCIQTFEKLRELEVARGSNNTTPVTYIICPGSVFDMSKTDDVWEMNGNTNYLCGVNGSSANKCIVTGGSVHFLIYVFPFDQSSKENILVSGFTFEKASDIVGSIGYWGKHTFRDCIFQYQNGYAVLQVGLYIPPTLRRRNRILSSNDKFDYRQDYINFLKDPQLRETRTHGAKDRLLLIGGGSEPRETLVLDTVQFLNNSLTSKIEIPSLAVNGPLDIFTAFSDVTVKDCLFKDNYYPYSRPIFTGGFGIKVDSSSTLNISNTCFVNEYYGGNAPVWIIADSGLVSSKNNYVSETPLNDFDEPISPCQYIFKEEAYKCIAPESQTCGLPPCAVSYKLYNARTNKAVASIVNGGMIRSPPCDMNIEAVLPCATNGKNVMLQLLHQNDTIISSRNETVPFFLFGNMRNNVLSGKIAAGSYKIQAVANGIVQPSPATFTLSGACKW